MSASGSGVDIGKEGSGQVEEKLDAASVFPRLRCSKCQDFFRGRVFGCTSNHVTCSLCCGVDIKSGMDGDVGGDGQGGERMETDNQDDDSSDYDVWWVCPMEDCEAKTNVSCVGKNLTGIVSDWRLKVPCKNRDDGCTHKGVEDEIEEHEDECRDRKVKCDYKRCWYIPFKDLLHHLRDEHKIDYHTKKWTMCSKIKPTEKGESVGYTQAFTYEIGPDGLVFITDVYQFKSQGHFHISVRVFGGKQVAKRYRAELRVSSNKSSVSITHSGPVFPIDYTISDALMDNESFEINCPRFALFNHGKEYFGKHNKEKNGKIVLPVSVKIEKKKLDIPTD